MPTKLENSGQDEFDFSDSFFHLHIIFDREQRLSMYHYKPVESEFFSIFP